MTYKEIVTLIKTIAETINSNGSFFHGRNYDTTLEFGAVYPQIHLYPFTMQPEQSNYNIIRSELLIAFWKEDGHENTMEQREDIIAAMDDLCVLFEAAIRATENVQVLSFRKEPQYLSQMGVVSGIACNISLHSAVLCAAPTTQAPINLTLPLITGLNTLGATLSGSNGTWSGNPDTFTYTYQWKRNGVNISGATNNTYVTTVLDSEAEIAFEVIANNGVSPNGVATSLAVTMADYTPVNILAPAISGVLELGSTLTGTNGSWTNSPSIFSYQWFRNGVEILGATSSTYALTLSDQETNITLLVSASNGLVGTQISNTLTVPSFATPPVFAVAPQVTGNAVVGQTLTCDGGTVTGTEPITKTFQWYKGASLIVGATNNTYTPIQADAGNTINIKCVVGATNSAGSASADSNTVAQILTVRTNSFLTASGISDATIRGGLNTFDIGLISNSLDTKMKAVYPFVGGTASTHRWNFMDARDLDAAFRLVFNGTNNHTSSGYVPNGTNGYAETFFNPVSQSLSTSSASMSTYQTQASDTGTSRTKIGADDGAALNMFGLAIFNAGIQEMGCVGGSTTAEYAPNGTSSAANGFIMVSTNGSRSAQHYKLGSTNGSPSTQTGAFPNRNIFIGAMNRSGTAMTFFNKPLAFAHIGDGFSSAQVTTLYNLVQALQTTLGRNV